jgi:hypothetical protein
MMDVAWIELVMILPPSSSRIFALVTMRSLICADNVITSPAISLRALMIASPIYASVNGVKSIVTPAEKLPGPKLSTPRTLYIRPVLDHKLISGRRRS